MKTRPHIVTQTCVHDTSALQRCADLLCARMAVPTAARAAMGYGRVLIRVMKIILDVTLHNDCYARRRDVLGSPRLRRLVMERLGGAHALLRWRRRNTWNTARLAAIASGEYRPAFEPAGLPARRQAPPQTRRAGAGAGAGTSPDKSSNPQTPPAKFRLPVLQNLRYVHRLRIITKHRAKPQKRFPAVVLWPHELDGQYVPNFQNRARVPDGGGYATYNAPPPPAGPSTLPIFAPP